MWLICTETPGVPVPGTYVQRRAGVGEETQPAYTSAHFVPINQEQNYPKGKKTTPAGEVLAAWGVSHTQEAAGTLMQGADQDIPGTLLSLSIFSVPPGAYFKNSALITQALLKPTQPGMSHQLHSGGTSLLSSSRDFSERYSF